MQLDITTSLYLDLMKRCLLDEIYQNNIEYSPVETTNNLFKNALLKLVESRGLKIVKPQFFNAENRQTGKDWPERAHTMIGWKRLNNLQFCVEQVLKNNIEGDLIETGVWRGGATIFMRAILKAYNVNNKVVWVADSFKGLPQPNIEKYPQDRNDTFYKYKYLQVSLSQVKENFSRYNLLDDQVKFLEGWFKDTLPNAPIERLAVLRLDGDMYESTWDALSNLYPKLSIGGYTIIDDFFLENCQQAVYDYRKQHNIESEIHHIDGQGIYWQREH